MSPIVALIIVLVVLALFLWWLFSGKKEEPAAAAPVKEKAPEAPDKLVKIEGIGPKTSELLESAGIGTFAALASTEVSKLDEIVDAAGYTMMDVSSWPEQATLAAAGKWEELQKLQDSLKGGKKA
jgi:predicted flap endonuclease-1-like 5' DNA nuclease